MRNIISLACISLMLSACGTPSDGYYDANGNWIPYNRYNEEAHAHSPLPGGPHPDYNDNPPVYTTTTTTYTYDRPGYYDYNGYYIARDAGPAIPPGMFPPRGMCRVWFTDRAIADQPPIETCDGIKYRVPAGAYVIYGG